MRGLAVLLLLAIFLWHDTAFLIANLTGWSASGVYYVTGALLELVLISIVAAFVSTTPRSVWRDLGLLACCIGASEALLMAGCQMAITGRPPPGMSQCDYVTGWPISATTTALYLFALAYLFGEWLRRE